MLKKLFKYDMRSISRLYLPAMLLVLGTTVLGSISLKLLLTLETWFSYESFGVSLFQTALVIVAGGSMLLVAAFAILSTIIIALRFYRHLFTDEGYLTHTLPVRTSTQLFSKLWSALLWMLIGTAAVIVYILIYITFGAAPAGHLINTEFYTFLAEGMHRLFAEVQFSGVMICVEVIVLLLVATVYSIFNIFLAITIGSIIAKKHKVLAAIGFYYLINTVVSILTEIFYGVMSWSWATNWVVIDGPNVGLEVVAPFVHTVLLFTIVFFLVISACCFTLCNYFLKKRLNLV